MNLSDWLALLELWGRCYNIKAIMLKYKIWDVEDQKSVISKAIKKCILKVGFIENFTVEQIKEEADELNDEANDQSNDETNAE